MSRGLLDAQNGRAPKGFNRRTFLKLGVSIGAAAGGGLMLGFSLPAVSQGETPNGKSVIGGDGIETPQSGVFEPNAFVQIDNTRATNVVVGLIIIIRAICFHVTGWCCSAFLGISVKVSSLPPILYGSLANAFSGPICFCIKPL